MTNTIDNKVNTEEWKSLPWRKLERKVFRLQTRIYKAVERDDMAIAKSLQKTLLQSWAARCLAVRRVTQDNQGKKTAGIDGIADLNPAERLNLAKSLKLNDKADAIRRVWIPKPGKKEKRPLGIPTMRERALQALAKMAIEPQWEARFEPNSYGFRPGRSAQDAVSQIHKVIKQKSKYVLDADIAKCFDEIDHQTLLDKIDTFPKLRKQIRAWLKSGVFENGAFTLTEKGTPQGGVISPLLANIALHGLEEHIAKKCTPKRVGNKWVSVPSVIRYADDFVIIHEDKSVVERCKREAESWLGRIGLRIKESKTQLTHTLKSIHGAAPGFEFLGFHIRQFPVGKSTSAISSKGEKLGFVSIIQPSPESFSRHMNEIGRIIGKHKAATQERLILKLNPIIKGWTNYYSTVSSKNTFSKADHLTYLKLWRWAKRRHPRKSKEWVKNKYWNKDGRGSSFFQNVSGKTLTELEKHSNRKCNPSGYIKVKGTRSPYDSDFVYWASRMGRHPMLPTTVSKLLKKQKGKCNLCGLYFTDDSIMEKDHIIPKALGGKRAYSNLQLLHRHCHDTKTAKDLKDINSKR